MFKVLILLGNCKNWKHASLKNSKTITTVAINALQPSDVFSRRVHLLWTWQFGLNFLMSGTEASTGNAHLIECGPAACGILSVSWPNLLRRVSMTLTTAIRCICLNFPVKLMAIVEFQKSYIFVWSAINKGMALYLATQNISNELKCSACGKSVRLPQNQNPSHAIHPLDRRNNLPKTWMRCVHMFCYRNDINNFIHFLFCNRTPNLDTT